MTASSPRLTLFLHFLFGAMAGSLYGIFEERDRLTPKSEGIIDGLGSLVGELSGLDFLYSTFCRQPRNTPGEEIC